MSSISTTPRFHGDECRCLECVMRNAIGSTINTDYERSVKAAYDKYLKDRAYDADTDMWRLPMGGAMKHDDLFRFDAQRYVNVNRHTKPQKLLLTPHADETQIVEFVVGKVPRGYIIDDKPCYLDFEDLPEHLKVPAMSLYAAIDSDEAKVTKVDGFGSIRKVFSDCALFYIRVAL